MRTCCHRQLAFGLFGVETCDEGISALFLPGRENLSGAMAETPLAAEAFDQLEAYFCGALRAFRLPLYLEGGSGFFHAVLEAMVRIPFGEVVTYGELAARAGFPGAARAAGSVCRKNPLPVFIPCHRVVASGGRLGGYGGGGALKRALLKLEGVSGL